MSTNKMADTGSHMSNSLVSQKSVNKLKYTTFVGNGDMTSSQTSQNVSLQEAFKRYRKQRQVSKLKRLLAKNLLFSSPGPQLTGGLVE